MKPNAIPPHPAALDLLEEAVHLLRTAPPRVLLAYYTGAIPFTLGLLFFWADMSCGAYAARRCPADALGLAGLFVWLKCWQAVFTSALRARLAAAPAPAWDRSCWLRLVLVQGILQPSRLFILPLAACATIPFAWVLAFYENLTVLGDGTDVGVRAVARRAAAQARLWPRQNHLLVALLALVAAVLWLNALVALLTAPQLGKLLLGVESAFSRAGLGVVLNTTFLAATLAVAWLALDPLLKAVYTLRCFHGEARTDGADLLAELARVRAAGNLPALAALLLLTCLPLSARAAATNAPTHAAPTSLVAPAQIEDAVKQTLLQDKYAWRLPREQSPDDDSPTKAWLRTFFASIGHTLTGWVHSVLHWIREFLDWFDRHFVPKARPAGDEGAGHLDWTVLLRGFAYALLAAAAAALVWLFARLWRQGWQRSRVVRAEVVPARPDLHDENVTAAQLPEDEWLKLAGELLNGGDRRLALRAFYLATLAHLAARDLVSLARFKSNHDYEQEVNRRARGSPDLRAAFAANVGAFERAWYGLYEVGADVLAQFQANFQRIRSC